MEYKAALDEGRDFCAIFEHTYSQAHPREMAPQFELTEALAA